MIQTRALEYNSQRENLVISEYGRHVQNLVMHAKTIEEKEVRQNFVEGIVKLMGQMNPNSKNALDSESRLWNHVFRIADYDLDVSPPEGVEVAKKSIEGKSKLSYPQNEFRFRHYGRNIQILIDKAIALEDKEKQAEFVKIIAAYMKLAYRTWNKEHFVNDEIIKSDIERLSKNQLKLEDEYNINNLSNNSRRRSNANQRRGRKSRPSNSNNNRNSFKKRR